MHCHLTALTYKNIFVSIRKSLAHRFMRYEDKLPFSHISLKYVQKCLCCLDFVRKLIMSCAFIRNTQEISNLERSLGAVRTLLI